MKFEIWNVGMQWRVVQRRFKTLADAEARCRTLHFRNCARRCVILAVPQ